MRQQALTFALSHIHDLGIACHRGVHVRLVAESLKRLHRYPLDPRDQGRFARIGIVEGTLLNKTATIRREQRTALNAQRNALSASKRMFAAETIATHLPTHPSFQQPGYIAGYWATGGELPLHVVQLKLRTDQIWCLPVLQDDGTLRFAPWRSGDALISNRFGIPEPDLAPDSLLDPDAMNLVLVPLLGFARTGHRLGMGGGYYDRTFAFRLHQPSPPYLIGVGYDFQEIVQFTPETWDVPLDAVVTERELIFCQR